MEGVYKAIMYRVKIEIIKEVEKGIYDVKVRPYSGGEFGRKVRGLTFLNVLKLNKFNEIRSIDERDLIVGYGEIENESDYKRMIALSCVTLTV